MRFPRPATLAVLIGLNASLASGAAQAFDDDFAAPISAADWTVSAPLNGASVDSGVADAAADDGAVAALRFPGGAGRRKTGPGWASQLARVDRTGPGNYRARLRSAPAAADEGVVSAFFTYFNDGSDADADGIADNSEIDIELLGAEPSVIYLSVWTDYEVIDDVEHFHKTTRRIDLATGAISQTPPGGEGSYALEPAGTLDWQLPGFDHAAAYRRYGFTWKADKVKFWIDLEDGAGKRTLWKFKGVADVDISSRPAQAMFNVWHNANAWDSGEPAAPPADEAVLSVDEVHLPD